MVMITDNLYERVLIEPARQGADKLYVLSGYASPAMVYRHLRENNTLSVALIIGMANRDGIGLGSHEAYKKLTMEAFEGRFTCKYLTSDRPAHLKLYGWYQGDNPSVGFVGSANYSQTGFSEGQLEAMAESEATPIKVLFDSLDDESVDCCDEQAPTRINFYDERRRIATRREFVDGTTEVTEEYTGENIQTRGVGQSVTLSFITNRGGIGTRSGINWGQRPGRNPNQAYLRVSAEIKRSLFFPPARQPFMIFTDDARQFDCVIAQGGEKGIHTYRDNSELGAYLRERMSVPSGQYVELDDFVRYGRSDVTIYKISDEEYYMDFST